MIHSYHPTMDYVISLNNAVMQGFFQDGFLLGKNYEVSFFYMETKTKNSNSLLKQEIANEILESIEQDNNFDVFMVSDDDAFQYVGLELQKKSPVVVHGLASLPEYYNETTHFFQTRETPGMNTTVVMKIFRFASNIDLINRASNEQITNKTVMFIFDSFTTAGKGSYRQFLEKLESIQSTLAKYSIKIEYHVIKYYSDYQVLVNKVNTNQTFGALYPFIFGLKDQNDCSIDKTDVYKWTSSVVNKITISNSDIFCEYMFGGLGRSVQESGKEAGEFAGYVLGGEKSVGDISFEMSPRVTLCFNLDIASKLGIEIDQFYLDQADHIIYTNSITSNIIAIVFPSLLVAGIGLIIIILILVCIALYLIIKKKQEIRISEITERISEMDFENSFIDSLLDQEKNSKIEKLLKKIILRLKEFRPYLPSSLFDKKEELESESASRSSISSQETSSTSLDSGGNTEISFKQYLSTSEYVGKKKKFQIDFMKKDIRKKKFEMKMEYKEVSLLCIKLTHKNGMESLAKKIGGERVLMLMNICVDIITKHTRSTKGSLTYVEGFKAISTWNAVRNQPSTHSSKACFVALSVLKSFKERKTNYLSSIIGEKNVRELDLMFSITTKEVYCGNCGNENHKLFNLAGEKMFEESSKLCNLNKDYETSILIDQECYMNVRFFNTAFGIDSIVLDESNKELKPIYTLIKANEKKEGREWMYQLDKSTFEEQSPQETTKKINADAFVQKKGKEMELKLPLPMIPIDIENNNRKFQKAFNYFLNGKYDESKKKLNEFLEIANNSSNPACILRLKHGLRLLKKIESLIQ